MKRILIGIGAVFLVLFGTMLVLPVILKDRIKAEIDIQLEKSVDADVLFDSDGFTITFFRNFPNLTACIEDFQVVGRNEFEGLPLASMSSFELEVNVFSLLGRNIKIHGVELIDPMIYVKVKEGGVANYNIIRQTATVSQPQSAEKSSSKELSLGIRSWKIRNGSMIYDDENQKLYTRLIGLNHKGSGDLSKEIFDLNTRTVVDTVTFLYDGSNFLDKKRLDIEMDLRVSNNFGKFTFRENSVRVNEFAFSCDGSVELNDGQYDMDVRFNTGDNSFKSILSILPQIILANRSKLEAVPFKG